MASRNYGVAYDTEYNRRLLDVLSKYDEIRDTNGEPDYIGRGGRLIGGARHPHLPHRVDMLDTGANMEGGQRRPPGMVMPTNSRLNGNIRCGTMATYPIYNALEMRAVERGGMDGGVSLKKIGKSLKPVGKTLKKIGKEAKPVVKEVWKEAKPIVTEVLKEAAKEGIKSYMKGGVKKPRGRPKRDTTYKPAVMPDEMVGLGVSSGGAKVDGRKRRAEIVKKVMKEKGMKMVDASKYVKQHGLY